MSVLLPAPLGPMIAVNSPDRNKPLTPFNIVLYPFLRPSDTENDISLNATSTGGHLGRCVKVTCTNHGWGVVVVGKQKHNKILKMNNYTVSRAYTRSELNTQKANAL